MVWYKESHRHSLAARGYSTYSKRNRYFSELDYDALKFKHGNDPDKRFDPSQLKRGIKVETEHTDDKSVAKQIAKAHLVEFPDYYDRLEAVERKDPGIVGYVHGVPIHAEKLTEGRLYPISPQDVKKVLGRMPEDDLKGITEVEFVNPKGEQSQAWAQYVRSRRKVLIFSQPVNSDGTIDGQNPDGLRQHIELYVLPHEIGHHKALYQDKITDKSLAMAEARADANVIGMSPTDKGVKDLKALRN